MTFQKIICTITLFSVLSDALPRDTSPVMSNQLGKRQMFAGVLVSDPPGAGPRRVSLETNSKIPGVKRVKIRSGPYKAPNMSKPSFPTGEPGMLWNFPHRNIEKPCTGECTILKQWAGLEYPDGSNANIDTGMWLHHMVHFTEGPTRWDAVCYNKISLPHLPVMTSVKTAERYFTSGNERTVFDFNPNGTGIARGSGYHITADDKFHYLVDLMNMNMEDKVVYMTMTYDYIDGPLPPKWTEVKSVWLDAASCGTSEVRPRAETGKFSIQSTPWKPNFEGRVLSAMGHLHDGGVQTVTMADAKQTLCVSDARYAEKPEFQNNEKIREHMGHDKAATKHISSMSKCKIAVPQMTKNQAWKVVGNYDYDRWDGNKHNDKQSEIMTISVVLVEVPRGGVPRPK